MTISYPSRDKTSQNNELRLPLLRNTGTAQWRSHPAGAGFNLVTLGNNSQGEIVLKVATSTAHHHLLSPPPYSRSQEATQGAWFDPALGKRRRYKGVTELDGARQGQTVRKGVNNGTIPYTTVVLALLGFTFQHSGIHSSHT